MEIAKLVSQQRVFFDTGTTKSIEYRKTALNSLYGYIVKNQDAISQALEKDLNKSEYESYITEIGLVLSEIKFVKKRLSRWASPKRRGVSLTQFPGKMHSHYEPYGVTLIISPWNYPFLLTVLPLIGAIAAGNCCTVKPSNHSLHTTLEIKKMTDSIFTPGYVHTVTGGREENTQLLNQKFDYIFFTGGKDVGRIVLEKASAHITPVTLELGGKSPCIVDKSADIDMAVKRIVFGKFINAGQTCIAPDYIMLDKYIEQEFLKKLVQRIQEQFGNALEENSDYPKIINQKNFDRLLGLLDNQEIHYGGGFNRSENRIGPTVLTNVKAESPVMQEEIFGPILPIITYSNLDECISFIKKYDKPLALYLFAKEKNVEASVIKNVSFGGGSFGTTLLHTSGSHAGFGGVGGSGMGSYHGKKSFLTFSHEKNILKQGSFFDNTLKYKPFSQRKMKLLKKIIK